MNIAPTATLSELRALPATVTIPQAGRFFGLSRARAYELAARKEFPVEVRQIGARHYCTLSDLAEALGVGPALLLAMPEGPQPF